MTCTETLTRGNIDRQLIRLSLPLLAGSLVQQCYNTVDLMIVSRGAGESAFAAVGVSGSVMNLFLYLLVGITLGFSILYANAWGAEDLPRLRQSLWSTGVLGLGTAVLLAGAGLAFLGEMLTLIRTPAPLRGDCLRYLTIILAGLPLTCLYNLLAALLRAIGRTGITLYALGAAMICNIGLDFLLVVVLRLGVTGAAAATVTAQGLSALLCGAYLLLRYPRLRPTRRDLRLRPDLMAQGFRYGSVSALQESSLFCGKLLIQSAVNAMGPAAVTAFAAASCVENFFLAFGNSGADALSVFIAQNQGAGCRERMAEGLGRGLRLLLGTGIGLSLLLLPLRGAALGLLIEPGNRGAMGAAGGYLLAMAALYPISFWTNGMQGYFRGIGRISNAFCATTLQISIRVLLTYLLPVAWGLLSVAAATGVGWVAMVVFQQARLQGRLQGLCPCTPPAPFSRKRGWTPKKLLSLSPLHREA